MTKMWWVVVLSASCLVLLIVNSGAGWKPEYAAYDAEIWAWFAKARSKVGGSCCDNADGYRLGVRYKFKEGGQEVERVMFASLTRQPEGYRIVGWDLQEHRYVDMLAKEDSFVPGNPIGVPIVWFFRPGGDRASQVVRCLANTSEG